MAGALMPKRVAVGDGRTIQLFGVRFGYKIESADSGGASPAKVIEMLAPGGLEEYFAELAPILARHEPPAAYYGLAERYGLTIEDDWIEEIEQRYGVKL